MTDPVTWHTKYSAEEVVWAFEYLCKDAMEFGEHAPFDVPAYNKAIEIRDYFNKVWPLLEKK